LAWAAYAMPIRNMAATRPGISLLSFMVLSPC
jgi:hypothetical protein